MVSRQVPSLIGIFAAAVLAAVSVCAQTAQPLDREKSRANPGDTSSQLSPEQRGDLYMVHKMYREAIEIYKKGPQDSPVIWNKIGIAYHQMLQLDAAKKNYEHSIRLNPKYPEAINNLGTVYYAQKSYRRAINQYRKALKLSPASASMYSNLGTAHFARKQYKEAFEAYQTALKLDPEVFERHSTYGVLLEERSVGERAKYHYYLAKTYAKAGINDRALQYLRKALEEGFGERKKIPEEPEFATLKDNPEFQQILAMEARVL
jgi:tetratricopeptide (TPR) repeat protein